MKIIICKDSSKDIWDSIKKKYHGTTRKKRWSTSKLKKSLNDIQEKNILEKLIEFKELFLDKIIIKKILPNTSTNP
jgi:hypothetical protein